MKISQSQPLLVSLSMAVILSLFSLYVYSFYSGFRKETFYELLEERAMSRRLTDSGVLIDQNQEENIIPEFSEEAYAFFDTQGQVLYRSDSSIHNLSAGQLQGLKKEVTLLENGQVQEIYITHLAGNRRLILYERAVDKAGYSKLDYLANILARGLLVSVLLVFGLVRFLIRRSLKPLDMISKRMRKITSKNLHDRLPEASFRNEIGVMARSFNELLTRVDSGYTQQKNFVSYATHELKTPLAILLGQAEVTLMRERDGEEYRQALMAVKEEVKEMVALVNDLLVLARANADSDKVELTAGRIDEILWSARKYIIGKKPDYKIRIGFAEGLENESFLELPKINKDLLKIALANLMENACKYSDDHACEVLIDATHQHSVIRIADKGRGIPDAEIKHIFEPFYRASHTRKVDGHGLGLPLVKRVVEIHQGEIELVSEENVGTTVTLRFPLR